MPTHRSIVTTPEPTSRLSVGVLVLTTLVGCGKTAGPTDGLAASTAPASARGAVAPTLAPATSGSTANEARSGCTRMWDQPDAVLRSRSMYEDLTLDRAKRTLTEKVSTWPAAKTVKLADDEAAELDAALGSLCLVALKDQPPPPPGGPMDVTITTAAGAARRLGVRGNTGGDFFELTSEQATRMFDAIKKMAPDHRDCLALDKDGVSFSGPLSEAMRSGGAKDGERYPVIMADGTVCVAPEGTTPMHGPAPTIAGSIEVRPASKVTAPMKGRPVTATGRLTKEARGDKTDIVMTVTSIAPR